MIRLLAMGQCAIELDGSRLTAESEVVFGLLLFLAGRAGDAVSREDAQALLWPDLPHTRGRHCLRQAAYRLRQLGVPLRADNGSLGVALGDVTSDFAPLVADNAPASAYRQAGIGDILPGYLPAFSTPFAAWVEEYRTKIGVRMRQGLVRNIMDLRSKGRYREVEPLARACLTLDPFNEIATLTLAEATAVLGGNRAEAMAILDRYMDEVGASRDQRISLPASMLRKRISERFVEQRYAAPPDPPFVGREDVLQLLVEKMQEAVAGRRTVVYLWGEPGIGKTRLLEELTKVAHVQGVRLERYTVSPNDPARPLALFSSVLPRMMRMPGAVGISPGAYEALMRFIDPESCTPTEPPRNAREAAQVFARLKNGICELFEVLSEEHPLVFLVDDLHWVDARSVEILTDVFERLRKRRLAFVFTSREPSSAHVGLEPLCARAAIRRVDGLDIAEVEALLVQIAGQRQFNLTPEFVRQTLDTSAGNPLFVSELATHYGWNGVRDDLPHNMQTLLQKRMDALSPGALLVFQACAVLGEHATVERSRTVLGLSFSQLAICLQELELAGLLVSIADRVSCRHQLLAREAQRRLTPSVARALHTSAANALRLELDAHVDLALAHACLHHFVDAHEPSIGVRVAIGLARRFIDMGMPNDGRLLVEAAEALVPDPSDLAKVLAVRLLASRAGGAWNEVNRTLAEIESLAMSVDGLDDGELRRIAFEARTYKGDPAVRGVDYQVALLKAGDLTSGTAKKVAINALIACCDAFDNAAAREVFSSYFRSAGSRLASLEDLVGNLLYHTSFGSLDDAVEIAALVVSRCVDARRHGYRQTQLIRWCARPYHLVGDEDQAQALLADAWALATKSGQLGEALECRVQNVLCALDLEDSARAADALSKVVSLSTASRTLYSEATLLLLQLREAALRCDIETAARCMAGLERCRLPDWNRVRLTLSACRMRTSALTGGTPSERDVENVVNASDGALASMEMDWTVSALCALAAAHEEWRDGACRLVARYLPIRRARFRIPDVIMSFSPKGAI
jgi:DNA-binding SARP family transcriptional activator